MSYKLHLSNAQSVVARCAIVTLSDTRTPDTDSSGQRIGDMLQAAGHAVAEYHLIKDDAAELAPLAERLIGGDDIDVLLTTGGTGIAKRDVTIGVIERLIEQPLPGFGELFRMLSWEQIGSGAMLSRAVGGIANRKLVFAMPGSTNAVELAMERLVLPELGHLLDQLRR
jgi:molybdenum cofactor biosynthesis protein B